MFYFNLNLFKTIILVLNKLKTFELPEDFIQSLQVIEIFS